MLLLMQCSAMAGYSHLLQIVHPVDMGVGGQVNPQVATIQGACSCTKPQQGLDVLGLQLCCFQHVCQACLHNNLLGELLDVLCSAASATLRLSALRHMQGSVGPHTVS